MTGVHSADKIDNDGRKEGTHQRHVRESASSRAHGDFK